MALSKEQKETLAVYNKADLASVFGVHVSTVNQWIEYGMPRTQTSGEDSKVPRYKYYIWEIAPWLRQKGPWQYPPGGGGNGENRGLRAGSPLIEETQRLKLANQLLDLSVRRRKFVDVALVREALLRWARRRRREIEIADKRYGRDVAKFLNDGLEAEKEAIDNDFPIPEPGTELAVLGIRSGNGTAGQTDKPVGGERDLCPRHEPETGIVSPQQPSC